MTTKQVLRKSLEKTWCIRILTRDPESETFDGIVTHVTKEFVALQEVSSFEFDGTLILPRREIRGVLDRKYERCRNAIIRENGQLAGFRAPSWLDGCKTLSQVFESLHRSGTWPAIDRVYRKRTRTALYLGQLTDVTRKQLAILAYDAAGKWEGEYRFALEKVVRIEIGSAYCRHFNAYMRTHGRSERDDSTVDDEEADRGRASRS